MRDALAPVFSFDPAGGLLTASVTRRAGAEGGLPVIQGSADLETWGPAPGVVLMSNERVAGSSPPVDRLTFTAPLSSATSGFFRVAF